VASLQPVVKRGGVVSHRDARPCGGKKNGLGLSGGVQSTVDKSSNIGFHRGVERKGKPMSRRHSVSMGGKTVWGEDHSGER